VAILVAGLLGLHQLRRMLDRYTDTQPLPLPVVEIAPDALTRLERRVETFKDDLRAGRTASPLVVSSDELNALIENDPEFKSVKGKVYVMIEGDRLRAQISLPMKDLGLPRFKGRYLNGEGAFSLSFRNGVVEIHVLDLTVKGKPVPPTYLDVIRKQNLANSANEDARASVGLNQLQNIQVQDGKLILVPKPSQ